MFYSVRETWSHVIEMLRRYWLEVRFVFFAIFRSWLLLVVSYFFVFLAILLIIHCYPEKNKIWNFLSSLSSAMFLVRETWMQLAYKFLVPSFSYEFLVRETWTVCHQLNSHHKITHSAQFCRSWLSCVRELQCVHQPLDLTGIPGQWQAAANLLPDLCSWKYPSHRSHSTTLNTPIYSTYITGSKLLYHNHNNHNH